MIEDHDSGPPKYGGHSPVLEGYCVHAAQVLYYWDTANVDWKRFVDTTRAILHRKGPYRAITGGVVMTSRGPVEFRIGDYVVQTVDSNLEVITAPEFHACFVKIRMNGRRKKPPYRIRWATKPATLPERRQYWLQRWCRRQPPRLVEHVAQAILGPEQEGGE